MSSTSTSGASAPQEARHTLLSKDTAYFEHARPEVVALVPATARCVLDIGCASGRLGALVKERQAAEVVGIELQPEAAALARQRLDQVLEQNIEDDTLDFPDGRFDCVVCADILEHLREPAQVLAKIRRWLTPDGVLVASLPNVRHHSVISSLLEGNWTYEAAGLLDSDHVRFFTRREIEKLLYRQGFEIEVMQAKPGPGYDEWNNAGRSGNVRIGSLNIAGMTSDDAQEFFTYQYLVVARRSFSPLRTGLDSFPPLRTGATEAAERARREAEGGRVLENQGGASRSEAEALERLTRDYPWPAEKPDVPAPTDKLGWFKEPQQELMRRELNAKTKLVVELGAWLGLSTRFIADQAPQARVITIDHWQGSSEHRNDPACAAMLPTLFETFVALNWEYRDRILPLRMTAHEGLRTIAGYGLTPDMIFIDADHSYEAVGADLKLSRELFPQARLIGDDYDSPDVRRAVDEFAASEGLEVEPVGTGWRSWRLVSSPSSILPPRSSMQSQSTQHEGGPILFESVPVPRSPDVKPSLTSIIIVTHNQLAYTRECVDSIRLRTDEPYELIFIDNGSTDGTVEYLRHVSHHLSPSVGRTLVHASPSSCKPASHRQAQPTVTVPENHPFNPGTPQASPMTSVSMSSSTRGLKSPLLLIENADNRGFPAAVNQGLQIAHGDVVLLLNNDTVVTTGWLRRMRDVLESDPRIGLVGPCSNCVSGGQMVPAGYQGMESLDGFAWDWSKQQRGVIEETDRLIGFCLAIKRAVIDQIGLFDERFGIGCFEDDDFCLRALQAGWRAVIARDTFIHHYGNRTFQGSGIDLGNVLDVNRQKFLDKWQITLPPLARGGQGGAHGAPVSPEIPGSTPTAPSSVLDPPSSIIHPPTPDARRFRITSSPSGGLVLQREPSTEAKSEIPNPKSEIGAKPPLTLCMIVRDNETTIGAALESIRPYVDEIVVVDTGSTDKTPEICRQYGARLFEFPWCDDFSAARNESLKQARGEWIFWMDSDDTISPECGRQLRELVDQLCKSAAHPALPLKASRGEGPVLGYVMQVHCPGPGQEGRHDVTVVDHLKLIRNRPDLKFEGRIHEQLLPAIRRAGGEVAWTDIHVIHSGSDHSPAGWQRKLDRDLRILHGELADAPSHPFVLFNLGMTYADAANNSFPPSGRGGQGGSRSPRSRTEEDERWRIVDGENVASGGSGTVRHDPRSSILHPQPARQTRTDLYHKAIHYLEQCLAASVPEESHVRKAFAILVSSLSQADRHEEAWTVCCNGLALYADDKELLFRSAMLHHHFGRLRQAEEAYLRVLNAAEERHFSSVDHGLAGFKARHNLAIVYEDMGRLAHAEAEWRKIIRDEPDYSPARRALQENLVRQGKSSDPVKLMQA